MDTIIQIISTGIISALLSGLFTYLKFKKKSELTDYQTFFSKYEILIQDMQKQIQVLEYKVNNYELILAENGHADEVREINKKAHNI